MKAAMNETADALSEKHEAKRYLKQAANEIRHLRAENARLSAQMFVVEAFHAALLGVPRGGGMSADLVWEIERHLHEVEANQFPHDAEREAGQGSTYPV
jgi:hypothetical protein